MLRIIVQELPLGYGPPKTVDVVEIVNDGTGKGGAGNYRIRRKDGKTTVFMCGWDRSKGWLGLVWRALAFLDKAQR